MLGSDLFWLDWYSGGAVLPMRVSQQYSRAERLSDAIVHLTGIAAAVIAAPVLVLLAWVWFGDVGTVTAAAVYAVSLLAMLVCSALYNMMPHPAWRDRLRRVDQSAIYIKIAGSYTPFAILAGSQTWGFLAGIWGGAIAGAVLILFGPASLRRPSFLFYLALGWAVVVLGRPLLDGLSGTGLHLVMAAGILYTVGVLFLLWERLPHHNTVWHVFVLIASATVYGAVVVEFAGRAIG